MESDTLAEAWEREAANWLAWARGDVRDSYPVFHRDAFLPLVPAPGRWTLDVGCGEGRVARDLTALGHRVIGVDRSPTMAAAAWSAGGPAAVLNGDAAHLPIGDGAVDLVVAFMSLQDVDDMPAAIAEIARVLAPAGRACIAVVHPINSAGKFEAKAEDAPFRISGSYLERRRYSDSLERNGRRMTFHSLHHPLEAYARAFEDAGLLVEAMREPPEPGDVRWSRVPLFLHFRLVKRPIS